MSPNHVCLQVNGIREFLIAQATFELLDPGVFVGDVSLQHCGRSTPFITVRTDITVYALVGFLVHLQ